jgi:AcrR family transcriptional regulator
VTEPRGRLEGPDLFVHPVAAALIAVIAERGYANATITEIVSRAGIERAEFDRLFDGKEDAAVRVFESYGEEYQRRALRAYRSEAIWPDSLRAAAYVAARWILEYPEATRFGMVNAMEAGEALRLRRESVFRWSAALIEEGRKVAADPSAVPAGAALMAAGAVAEILNRQVQGTIEADPIEMVPQLMYGAVRPYLGEAAARRELSIPPPPDLELPPPA